MAPRKGVASLSGGPAAALDGEEPVARLRSCCVGQDLHRPAHGGAQPFGLDRTLALDLGHDAADQGLGGYGEVGCRIALSMRRYGGLLDKHERWVARVAVGCYPPAWPRCWHPRNTAILEHGPLRARDCKGPILLVQDGKA